MTAESQTPQRPRERPALPWSAHGAVVPLPVESKVADMSDRDGQDGLPRQADIVFVGAGHNALVAAAYLLDAGRSVTLLEQMPQPGGWVQTAELGAPGFHHDRYSSLHPAFVGGPAFAELGRDLGRHGLEYVTAPLATASSLPDGRTAIVPVDPEAFAAELERLGETTGWNALLGATGAHLQTVLGLLGDGLDGPGAGDARGSAPRRPRRRAAVRPTAHGQRARSAPQPLPHRGAAIARGAVAAAPGRRARGPRQRPVGDVRPRRAGRW